VINPRSTPEIREFDTKPPEKFVVFPIKKPFKRRMREIREMRKIHAKLDFSKSRKKMNTKAHLQSKRMYIRY
jgi:hypothetical protein